MTFIPILGAALVLLTLAGFIADNFIWWGW